MKQIDLYNIYLNIHMPTIYHNIPRDYTNRYYDKFQINKRMFNFICNQILLTISPE